jgi:hypothetical protein
MDIFTAGTPVMISDDLTQEIQRIDRDALREFIDRKWDDEILPALTDYIAVPAKSPMFDLDWARNGFIERVITDAAQWAERQPVRGLKVEIIRLPNRTPVIFFEAPATRSNSSDTIVLYGHGRPNTKTASSTDGAARTTDTLPTRRSARSPRWMRKASNGRAVSALSKHVKNRVAMICCRTLTRCVTGSAT